jgi:formylglycine-generating enzyme required for sulfatase activity
MRRGKLYVLALAAAALVSAQRTIVPSGGPGSGRRVALVVGNQRYTKQPLVNPENDANDVAVALQGLGFEVMLKTNLSKETMDGALIDFTNKLNPGDTGLFYFSGHAMELAGQNYLLPVDFNALAEFQVRTRSLNANEVLEGLRSRGVAVSILILDACRNNPYRTWRAEGGGLAALQADGAYVAFAAAPGQVASDNPGQRNGLFTKHLKEVLAQPGLSIDDVFSEVRQRVYRESTSGQRPYSTTGLIGRFYFRQGRVVAPDPEPPRAEGPQPLDVRTNSKDGQRYVFLPAGKFRMGCSPDDYCTASEKPPREVELTRPFWIAQTEVTVAAYERYRKATGKPALVDADLYGRKLNAAANDHRLPVVQIRWEAANDFCAWAGMRLPTAAEFEYAARANIAAPRYGPVNEVAWYADNAGNRTIDSSKLEKAYSKEYGKQLADNGNGPKPVALKQPNAFLLYDMLGNVAEWTEDWYREDYYQRAEPRDPKGPPSGEQREARGGSWEDPPMYVNASTRYPVNPTVQSNATGFRCAGDRLP